MNENMNFRILKDNLISSEKVRTRYNSGLITLLLPFLVGIFAVINLNAQCKGVTLNSAVLSVVGRPCGKTPTGALSLEIKGGLAPYSLTWYMDSLETKELPVSASSRKLIVENLNGAMKPGYVVRVKDACGNKTVSTPIKLLNGPSIQFSSAPQTKFQDINNVDSTGSIRVEIVGGISPRTLIATDSKGHVFSQSIATSSPGNAIFVYELDNLPNEKYSIEIKSGTQNCSQFWKEPIELKLTENN